MAKNLVRPSEEMQMRVFCDVYSAVKNIKLDWASKYAGFERILFDSKLMDHWMITGVSQDALMVIAKNGFVKNNQGVVRGHIIGRRARAEVLFRDNNFKTDIEAYDYFIEHDKVVLITKAENGVKKTSSDWSKVYNLDDDLFPFRCGYSATYTENALSCLRQLAKNEGII